MAVKVALAPTPGEMRWIELFHVPLFYCRFLTRASHLSASAVLPWHYALPVRASFLLLGCSQPSPPLACCILYRHRRSASLLTVCLSPLRPPPKLGIFGRGPLLAGPIWYSQEQVLLGTALLGSDPPPSPSSCRWLWWGARPFISFPVHFLLVVVLRTGLLLVPGSAPLGALTWG